MYRCNVDNLGFDCSITISLHPTSNVLLIIQPKKNAAPIMAWTNFIPRFGKKKKEYYLLVMDIVLFYHMQYIVLDKDYIMVLLEISDLIFSSNLVHI